MTLQHRLPLLPVDAEIVSKHLAVDRNDGNIIFFNASVSLPGLVDTWLSDAECTCHRPLVVSGGGPAAVVAVVACGKRGVFGTFSTASIASGARASQAQHRPDLEASVFIAPGGSHELSHSIRRARGSALPERRPRIDDTRRSPTRPTRGIPEIGSSSYHAAVSRDRSNSTGLT